MSDEKEIAVSVITVCYNAEKVIEKTIQSVLSQNFTEMEYIIKDGGSQDKTNEIVKAYKEAFQKKGVLLIHEIRKDKGIYDAMNQATQIASGEYVNYMNADDMFFDENVLQKVFGKGKQTADVLYGDSVCEYEFIRGKKEYTLWKGQAKSFATMPFSHQACFLRTSLMKEYSYDTRFRSAADFHVLSRFLTDRKTFAYIDCIISLCTMDGVSNTGIKRSYMESVQIKQELQMKDFLIKDSAFSIWLMGVKQWILKHMPYGFVGRLLRLQVKRKGERIYRNINEIIQND